SWLLTNLLKEQLVGKTRGRKGSKEIEAALRLLSPNEESPDDAAAPDAKEIGNLALEALWQSLGDDPTILFFDDLQWADESSLELVPLLASAMSGKRLVLVITCRDDDLTRQHPARQVRARLRRFRHTFELPLEPLSAEEVGALAEEILGGRPDPELLDHLCRRTNGLPLFVEEFCRSIKQGSRGGGQAGTVGLTSVRDAPVPESIRDAVSLQCESLGEESYRALEVAAVLGMEFTLNHLVELGVPESAPDELFDRQFVVSKGDGRGVFRHTMTREAVLDEIPWSRRRRLHGRTGDLLKRLGDRRHYRAIAGHYRDAGRHGEAREAFLEAARLACSMHAYRDASGAFEQALRVWPEGELELERLDCMERLATCAQTCGFAKESVRAWRDVAESESIQADPARKAMAWGHLASALEIAGSEEQALSARERALDAYIDAGLHAEAASEALGQADINICKCRFGLGKEQAECALEMARRCGDLNLESKSLSAIGLALAMQGKKTAARRRIESGLELAINHDLKEAIASAYTQMAYVHGYQGDYAGQRESFGAAVNFCKREGLEARENSCLGCMAYAIFRLGDWKRSTEISRDILASDPSNVIAATPLGLIFTMRGQLKQARRTLEEAQELARQAGITPIELIIQPALALLDHYADATPAAIARFSDLLTLWESTEDCFDSLFGLCIAASFFSELGMANELNACAASIQKVVYLNRNPESLGSLAHALGEVAFTDGRFADAATHFLQARAQFERIQVRHDIARSEFRAGHALLEAGATEVAIEHLRAGYVGAKALGARPLQELIRRLLERVDAAPEEPRSADAPERAVKEGLTRRQLEVAKFIAQGMTNKEVAEKLHLSPRTVDMHVRNLFDRIDCSTRSEAVRRLCDLGLLD
ncbi:MAG: helix-turn-helix transcriptional regulator, partial [Verrucomicrobiales bacterium]